MRYDVGDGIWLYTADEWRTVRHQPKHLDARPQRERSIVEWIGHHSGGATLGAPATADWLRAIYDYHVLTRGYSDIAYQAAVRDGTIWELRPGWAVGAHTSGHNSGGYGVVLLRDAAAAFENREKLALRKTFQMASFAAARPLEVLTHRQTKPTECPGDDVAGWIESGGLTRPREGTVPDGTVPAFQGVLRRGSTGEAVREFERQLRRRGWRLTVDNRFGSRTEEVVRKFQANQGLPVTGVVDHATWNWAFMAPISHP